MEDKEEICHIFYFIFSSVLYDLFLLSAPKSLDFLSRAKAFSTEWPRYQVSEYQILYIYIYTGFLIAQLVKNLSAMQETPVQFLGQEDPLGKGQATYSSIHGLLWWLRQ